MPTDKTAVEFHYIKSNTFRVIHVDGAFGGITPAGLIFVSMYSGTSSYTAGDGP